jgi:hypothetical protein
MQGRPGAGNELVSAVCLPCLAEDERISWAMAKKIEQAILAWTDEPIRDISASLC